MKVANKQAGRAFSDGYAKGRDDERARNAETITKLKEALTRALEENLAMRPKR
jgi:hypothetical protein